MLQIPSGPLRFGSFVARFDPDGTFRLDGDTWRGLVGDWKINRNRAEIELTMADGPGGCLGIGRYRVRVDAGRVTFDLVSDACPPRRMIFDGSTWSPAEEVRGISCAADLFAAREPARLFRTPQTRKAVGPRSAGRRLGRRRRQNLPDQWDGETGENILWRTPIPGLAHSSPVVWGHRTSSPALSAATPKRASSGLYGDGDASKDRSRQRWMIYALDKRTGKVLWERVAHQGVPIEKRHIKSTYANSTPATDGRSSWRGSDRRASMLTMSTAASLEGRPGPARPRRVRYSDLRMGPGQFAYHLEQSGHPAVRHAGRLFLLA